MAHLGCSLWWHRPLLPSQSLGLVIIRFFNVQNLHKLTDFSDVVGELEILIRFMRDKSKPELGNKITLLN